MTKFSKIALCALIIGSSAFFTSCDDTPNPKNAVTKTLYQKLGGTTMVTDPDDSSKMIEQGRLSFRLVTNSTIQLIVADITAGNTGNFAEHFAPLLAEVGAGNNTNAAVLSKNITDIFSVASGGQATNTYSGLDMVTTHDPALNPRMGKKVSNADMDRFIGFVGEAAGINGVTDPVIIAEVVALLETLRAPIVQG
ncbi:hypothetical protein [Flavobacterium sp. SM2513]|uniref:hypothetical protein n=1 Tax=Flavobacterium sp. SM2513 TaxID=3424766 RepID=UPI003D7FE62F